MTLGVTTAAINQKAGGGTGINRFGGNDDRFRLGIGGSSVVANNLNNVTNHTSNTVNQHSQAGGVAFPSTRSIVQAIGTSDKENRNYPSFVVLVDIDGTIIGDIDAQLTEYQLLIQGPSKKRTRDNQNTFRGKMFKDQLVTQLMNGLMRPGFSQFCAQCAMLNIPVMLYTAAEHDWATFLAPRILHAVRLEMIRDFEKPPMDFKFARLFTRRFCGVTPDGSCKKSLDLVIKYIYSTLRKDYTMSKGIPTLLDRIIMIDNTEGILEQKRNLVLVPTYNYAHLYDVTATIDHSDSRRLYRARQLITDIDNSFLGERRAKELRNAVSEGKQPFRALFYQALSKAMVDNALIASAHGDPLWRTLRNRLMTYMRTVTDPAARNAYDLAKYLAGHISAKGLLRTSKNVSQVMRM